ncbi:MAG: alpha-ketoglutarate-dependent dioxygenase AlkB [Geminicoccaceae bacterium]|nr:MAG: alpha-ketoglutarate-dependent dioxygenase AlkB [Geminicoccaceae bacterium]
MTAASELRSNLLPRDGLAWLVTDALAPAEAAAAFDWLQARIAWRQEAARIMGRTVPLPRLTAWYGDGGYAYSGIANPPQPWLPELKELALRAEEVAGVPFDSVLCNLYRDGRDSVSWHRDAEPMLGPDPIIASLSLGAVRRFRLRHVTDRSLAVAIDLPPGSLLVMGRGVQRFWQHALPKTAKPIGPRINLTFRRVGLAVS